MRRKRRARRSATKPTTAFPTCAARVAMARTNDPHSASAQFFVNLVDNKRLDYMRDPNGGANPVSWGYAVFGKVVERHGCGRQDRRHRNRRCRPVPGRRAEDAGDHREDQRQHDVARNQRAGAMSTLFISDLHLDESRPEIVDVFERFLASEARGAEALYILGDLFESWIGDDDDSPMADRVARALRALQRRAACRSTSCAATAISCSARISRAAPA